ncbi:MAG: glycosyltransferase involved in cell wall biosynthesis [Crocinitomicaceae bacterium]|jgi:glycosyltransferase involved in cell wall biosynthesis
MRIAVNTRFLLPTKMEGFGWYTNEIVKRLVQNHPEHTFIFFFDRPYDERFIFGTNVEPVVLKPQARHPILFKIWFNHSVTRALKKHRADIFYSPDGYLSLKTEIPQISVIHDINFEHYPEDLPKSPRVYLRKFFPKFAEKARHIITVSEASKKDICTTYGQPSDKITVSWNGASEVFQPISDSEKQKIRDQYTNGKPFLLFVGALHPRKNLKRLLEAYSCLLKSDPDCPYELIIVGEALWKRSGFETEFDEALKKRVHFTGHLALEQLARVMASATVFTFVPYFEGFGIPLVEAMRSGTPILAGNKSSLPEVGGDAVLYCDPFDVQDIFEKLTQILSDEALRETLIQKGLERSKLFSWDDSAKKVWEVIANSVETS